MLARQHPGQQRLSPVMGVIHKASLVATIVFVAMWVGSYSRCPAAGFRYQNEVIAGRCEWGQVWIVWNTFPGGSTYRAHYDSFRPPSLSGVLQGPFDIDHVYSWRVCDLPFPVHYFLPPLDGYGEIGPGGTRWRILRIPLWLTAPLAAVCLCVVERRRRKSSSTESNTSVPSPCLRASVVP